MKSSTLSATIYLIYKTTARLKLDWNVPLCNSAMRINILICVCFLQPAAAVVRLGQTEANPQRLGQTEANPQSNSDGDRAVLFTSL